MRAALPAGDDVGIVDVALAPRMALLELGHDLKLTDQLFQIESVNLGDTPSLIHFISRQFKRKPVRLAKVSRATEALAAVEALEAGTVADSDLATVRTGRSILHKMRH